MEFHEFLCDYGETERERERKRKGIWGRWEKKITYLPIKKNPKRKFFYTKYIPGY